MAKKKPLKKYQAKNSEVTGIDKIKSAMNAIATAPAPKGNFKFKLEGGMPYGPGANTPYIVDTTGLSAGKQSFPMRYGPGVQRAGERVGNMTAETVKRLVKNQGGKKAGGAITAMDKLQAYYKNKKR